MIDFRLIEAAHAVRLGGPPHELWSELDARYPRTSSRPQIIEVLVIVIFVLILGFAIVYRPPVH